MIIANPPVVVLFVIVVEIVARLVVFLEKSLRIKVQIMVILLNISLKPTEVIVHHCIRLGAFIAVMVLVLVLKNGLRSILCRPKMIAFCLQSHAIFMESMERLRKQICSCAALIRLRSVLVVVRWPEYILRFAAVGMFFLVEVRMGVNTVVVCVMVCWVINCIVGTHKTVVEWHVLNLIHVLYMVMWVRFAHVLWLRVVVGAL